MQKHMKKLITGGIVATMIAVPSYTSIKTAQLLKEQREVNRLQKKEQLETLKEYESRESLLLKEYEKQQNEINSLQKKNKKLESKNKDLEGVRRTIISSVGYLPTTEEKQLLERLVECEAGGESLAGKIAVANVVLNRVKSKTFPNTITGVLFQTDQFQPVGSGIIYSKVPSDESKEAVKMAFMGERVIASDMVYFWATWLNSDHAMWNQVKPAVTIGNHHFGSE